MPTKTKTTTTYLKIIGHREQPDGDVEHLLREVTDFTGDTWATRPSAGQKTIVTNAGNEQPRGTIVKMDETETVTYTLNPTA